MKQVPVIVIGASAGGVEAVARIISELPADLPAAVFVAMHFPANVPSVLPRILSRAGSLDAIHPENGDRIQAGRIYVCPPDHHLMVGRKKVTVVRGPREHGHRPAIDPMFRSAATSHGNRVIGVLLTGNLDDGTAGMLMIKRRGGIAVVQDPCDAVFPSMPQSAIDHVEVDHIVPLSRIPKLITTLAEDLASLQFEPRQTSHEGAMSDADRENHYDELDLDTVEEVEKHPGRLSQFGCPDCGGVLWEIEDGSLLRFRCRVGHAWSSKALRAKQLEQLDSALWTALRTLEEQASLATQLAERSRRRGMDFLVGRYETSADEARARARTIREFLLRQFDDNSFEKEEEHAEAERTA